jgi:hypothetical protein
MDLNKAIMHDNLNLNPNPDCHIKVRNRAAQVEYDLLATYEKEGDFLIVHRPKSGVEETGMQGLIKKTAKKI